MTTCIGVFMVPTGFRFVKPHPGNPCGAWAAGEYRGIRGFISTAEDFFKNDHRDQMSNQGYQQKKSSGRKKPWKPQKPR